MFGKDSPQSVIDSHKRRQQMTPFIVWSVIVLLVVVGVIILVVWFTGSNNPAISLFASPTPTATNTFTVTPVTPTLTSTVTSSPTVTMTNTVTSTPAGPFEYTVKEGDTCWDIAVTNKVTLDVLLALNNFGNSCPIKPGDKIMIPTTDQELPTETALPTGLARGTKVEYTVKSGDILQAIADRYFSTVDAIIAIKENNLKTAADLKAGQKLIIPINIATAVPTKIPTATRTPGGPTETNTPVPATATATATAKP
jgi:LysM repeat protein